MKTPEIMLSDGTLTTPLELTNRKDYTRRNLIIKGPLFVFKLGVILPSLNRVLISPYNTVTRIRHKKTDREALEILIKEGYAVEYRVDDDDT